MNNGIIAQLAPRGRTFSLRETARKDLGLETLMKNGPFRSGNKRAQKLLKQRLEAPFREKAPIAAIHEAVAALLAHPQLALIKISAHALVINYREYCYNTDWAAQERYRVSHAERFKRLKYILSRADGISKIIRPGESTLLAQIKHRLAISAPNHPLNEVFRILNSGHVTFDYVSAKGELTFSFEESPSDQRKKAPYHGMYGKLVSPIIYEKLWDKLLGKTKWKISKEGFNNFERFINGHICPPLDELSFCLALAQAAKEHHLVRPELTEDTLEITNGWHPGLSDPTRQTIVMPPDKKVLLISGLNDGGKTTTLRMLGLISLLAQIGSFVPAQAARLPIFDDVFTLFHVPDAPLEKGQLKNEVGELSGIWDTATGRSLVLIDELFRGTDPDEGEELFRATVEELPAKARKAMVATHFRRKLPDIIDPAVMKMRMVWTNGEKGMRPTYQIEDGVSEEAYAVGCAVSAGLPEAIVKRIKANRQ